MSEQEEMARWLNEKFGRGEMWEGMSQFSRQHWLTLAESAPVSYLEWEYGIDQGGKVWLLSESEYDSMEGWLEDFPLDKGEKAVKRRKYNAGPWEEMEKEYE